VHFEGHIRVLLPPDLEDPVSVSAECRPRVSQAERGKRASGCRDEGVDRVKGGHRGVDGGSAGRSELQRSGGAGYQIDTDELFEASQAP
jgi:hypothetical protein